MDSDARDTQAPNHGPKVLVVDDEAGIRALLERVLAQEGYDVATAHDGRHAMKLLNSKRFDLVITDLFMPERDGMETILEMRQTQPTPKIIAMSGLFQGTMLKVAGLLGADATLLKPFEVGELVLTVRSVLGR